MIGDAGYGYAAGNHQHPSQVQNNLTTLSTTLAPSVTAVRDSLAKKLDKGATLGLTGDVTASSATIGSASIATTLANTTVSAAAYGQTAAQTPGWGGTFSVPSFTVDAKGRLTAAGSHSVTLPSALASASADGLMSSAQYNLLSASQTAKTFFAAPYASDGAPAYRIIDRSDIPADIDANTSGNAATATALATAGTINVSGTATATTGGITSSTPTYTNGGNITISATVPPATATTAGAMSAVLYNLAMRNAPAQDNTTRTSADCERKFATGAIIAYGNLCGWLPGAGDVISNMKACANKGMRAPTIADWLMLATDTEMQNTPLATSIPNDWYWTTSHSGNGSAMIWVGYRFQTVRWCPTCEPRLSEIGSELYNAVGAKRLCLGLL
ncbi:hypothetical protein AGMMS49525_12960 [Bacteroidia bacterium]|nr:hypothetical protein AGMMS49525_12960 [Bacteroidia bacterium]